MFSYSFNIVVIRFFHSLKGLVSSKGFKVVKGFKGFKVFKDIKDQYAIQLLTPLLLTPSLLTTYSITPYYLFPIFSLKNSAICLSRCVRVFPP